VASSIAFDASTLINFHEAGSMVLLAKHFRGRSFVAGFVEDVELGGDATAIVTDGQSRWIERIEIRGATDLRRVAALRTVLGSATRHRGEAETLVVCEDRASIFATDDNGAALVAQSRGVRVASSVSLLNLFVAKNHLSGGQARDIAQRMQQAGQNVDPRKIQGV
jgi:predicted nucleic acid-binding protein